MIRTLLGLLTLPTLMFASSASPTSALDLLPMPASVQIQAGRLDLDGSFTIALTGCSDSRLERAVQRLQRRIEGRTGVGLPLGLTSGTQAVLNVACTADAPQYPRLGDDESYSLEIVPQRATLKASTGTGALRGMETVLQ